MCRSRNILASFADRLVAVIIGQVNFSAQLRERPFAARKQGIPLRLPGSGPSWFERHSSAKIFARQFCVDDDVDANGAPLMLHCEFEYPLYDLDALVFKRHRVPDIRAVDACNRKSMHRHPLWRQRAAPQVGGIAFNHNGGSQLSRVRPQRPPEGICKIPTKVQRCNVAHRPWRSSPERPCSRFLVPSAYVKAHAGHRAGALESSR